jgi:hypothetical protein
MSKETYPPDIKDVGESGLQNTAPLPVKTKSWWKLGGEDHSFVSVNAGYPNSASSSVTAFDVHDAAGHNVWENEESKELYKPIAGYEGSHRFDPSFEWDPEEEKRLLKVVSLISVS